MNLTTLDPNFLLNAKKLIEDVAKDKLVKEQISTFRFDDKRIKDSFDALYNAEKADQAYLTASDETTQDREKFFSLFRDAYHSVAKHFDFLKLIMENCIEKSFILVFGVDLLTREINDYFCSAKEIYYKLLTDPVLLEKLERYGIKEVELEEGLRLNLQANKAYLNKCLADRQIGKAATQRNTAFDKLFFILQELTIICNHSLGDHFEIINRLGITTDSPKLMMDAMVKDSSIT